MGHFDDVLAAEPGDEWDDDAAGAVARGRELPPTQATLRLPNASVELRGDVPTPLLDAFAALTDERLELALDAPDVPLVFRSDRRWSVSVASDEEIEVDDPRELIAELLPLLDRIAVRTDPDRLHLDAACVELDGVGVVILGERPDDRERLAEALLERGASLVASRVLTVLPGSHTVYAFPSPLRSGRAAHVAPYTTVGVVVQMRHTRTSAPSISPSSHASTCLGVLGAAIDRDRLGPASLDLAASLVAGATCVELHHDAVEPAARLLPDPSPPARRSIAVVHRFDDTTSRAPTIDHRQSLSLRVARFDDGAVALDGATGAALELSEVECDVLEASLVTGVERDVPDDASTSVRERLSGAGMHLPDERCRREPPGPEAFGLPNCPLGATARRMWSGGPSWVGAGSGNAADLAVLFGLVEADGATREAALERHRALQEGVVAVERELVAAVAALERRGIVPLVLGSVVHAHDGPLPPYFAEVDSADLLVEDHRLDEAVTALEATGHLRESVVSTEDEHRSVVELRRAGTTGPTVRLRDTLASGPFGRLVDHEEFHERSVPVRIHGRWCRALHPEHRFVHACVEVALSGPDPTVQQLRDVVLAAPRAGRLMAATMEASERWGSTSAVTAAVRTVDAALPGLSPWFVERSSRGDEGQRRRRGTVLGRARR